MKMLTIDLLVIVYLGVLFTTPTCGMSVNKDLYHEKYRPQYHFSSPTSWINDPNGLVYYKGEYHLFFQYNPGSLVWGPMHWGHAVSTDLLHWQNLPIAIYPDQDGNAFSGSAVVDFENRTGLQTSPDEKALIAIFTREKESSEFPQTQHLAYSEDKGRTWSMYSKNPVIAQPGKPNHRDPSLLEYNGGYILSAAAGDSIMFYQSNDLLNWTLLSSFGDGPREGSHGGVWECPILQEFEVNGKTVWVLLVSINPGGPTVGSATQYFVGTFDGTNFVNANPSNRIFWLDWGPDNYAAQVISDVPDHKPITIAWMSNWAYANNLPTRPWNGQMTLPRNLKLVEIRDDYHLQSFPIDKVQELRSGTIFDLSGGPQSNVTFQTDSDKFHLEADIRFHQEYYGTVNIELKNSQTNERVTMNLEDLTIEIDRSESGVVDFSSDFVKKIRGSRVLNSQDLSIDIFFDTSAIELFYDKGLTCFTLLVYPREKYDTVTIKCLDCDVNSLKMYQMASTWDQAE